MGILERRVSRLKGCGRDARVPKGQGGVAADNAQGRTGGAFRHPGVAFDGSAGETSDSNPALEQREDRR